MFSPVLALVTRRTHPTSLATGMNLPVGPIVADTEASGIAEVRIVTRRWGSRLVNPAQNQRDGHIAHVKSPGLEAYRWRDIRWLFGSRTQRNPMSGRGGGHPIRVSSVTVEVQRSVLRGHWSGTSHGVSMRGGRAKAGGVRRRSMDVPIRRT